MHDICFVRFGTGVPGLFSFLSMLNPYKKFVYQTSSTVKSSLFYFSNVVESQIKLLENSYIQ